MKLTKQTIIEGLRRMVAMKDVHAEVLSVANYTIESYNKNPRNVTNEDLQDTLKTVKEHMDRDTFTSIMSQAQGSLEASVKPKKVEKKVEPKAEPKAEEEVAITKTEKTEKKAEPKKVAKGIVKKAEPKTEKTEEKAEPKAETKKIETMGFAVNFPTEFENSIGKFKVRNDLKTVEDVVKAVNEDNQDIVLAMYWSARQLKQFATGYDPNGIVPKLPKNFEHDLDIVEITFAHERVVTGNSLYTIAPFVVLPYEFEIDEESGLRYTNSIEFQVYEVVEEKETETEE